METHLWFSAYHVCEYTVEDLLGELQEAGFRFVRREALHCSTGAN